MNVFKYWSSIWMRLLVPSVLIFSGCFRPSPSVNIRENTTPPTGAFIWPLKKHSLLSAFGKRGRSFHTGLDIRGNRGGGDNVFAARSGKVIKEGRMSGYGNIVVIRHSDGYQTRYAHLRKILVKRGQLVQLNEPIGIVGQTGRATTPHLHFEILTPRGAFTDPASYLQQN